MASKKPVARSKSPRKKKVSKDASVNEILAKRDKLAEVPEKKEAAHMACKGMYQCSKKQDKKCLDGIMAKLDKLEKSGGRKKAKSRSRSRSRSRKARR